MNATKDAKLAQISIANRIIVFGRFGQGNLGNELTLQALVDHLNSHYSDSNITCVCSIPEAVTKDFGIAALPIHRYTHDTKYARGGALARLVRFATQSAPDQARNALHALRSIRRGDMLIINGTGILESDETIHHRWSFELLCWCIAARMRGASVVFLSIGAGPIISRLAKRFVRRALRSATYVSYRDEASRERMADIGVQTATHHVFPDLAFSLPKPSTNRSPQSHTPPIVGVGIMDYYGLRSHSMPSPEARAAYLRNSTAMVRKLLDAGLHVVLIRGDLTYDTGPIETTLNNLKSQGFGPSSSRLSVASITSNEELYDVIAAIDVVISPRFHNLIVSLLFACPVISISYHDKNDRLLETFGLERFCHHIDKLDADLVVEQCKSLAQSRQQVSQAIAKRTNELREMAERQFRLVFKP